MALLTWNAAAFNLRDANRVVRSASWPAGSGRLCRRFDAGAEERPAAAPRQGNPRRYLVPKETTIFPLLLTRLDSRAMERESLAWQDHVLGPRAPDDQQVSVGGKELLGSQGAKTVSAYAVDSRRWPECVPVRGTSCHVQ